MKKLCLSLFFVVLAISCVKAKALADVPLTPPVAQLAPADIYFKAGPLNLTVPFQSTRIVALYDGVNKQALAGVETVIATLKLNKLSQDPWDFEGTVGAVTDAKAQGAPVIGINLAKDNPANNIVDISHMQLGVFAGYNPNAGNGSSKPIMAGAKMAYAMRFW